MLRQKAIHGKNKNLKIMKEELKFGIEEADKLIEDFENGDVTFLELTCGLWNGGYNACKEDQKIVSQRLMVGSKVFLYHIRT